MKKYFFLFSIFIFLLACEKEPDLDKVRGELVTYTQFDVAEDFGKASTYFIADKVLIVSDDIKDEPEYLPDSAAEPIIKEAVSEMKTRGYKRVNNKEEAHLGIQMSYIESTYYFINYDYPYWWLDYPWYWGPGYWGDWSEWYYPYPNVFYYSNGSLLIDMIDLRLSEKSKDDKLSVVWQAYSVGLLNGSYVQQIGNAINAVKQSFEQSEYILSNSK